MADFNAVATQFVNFYYDTFDRDRSALRPLYRDMSMLTFEGQQFQGINAIIEKLVQLPFTRVKHRIVTTDAQPASPSSGAILVSVTGQLLIDDGEHPQNFSQTFQLVPEGPGNYFVFNDIFRLNYG